jgi:outer membrane receptor protein involved in Fe transport
MTSPHRRPRKRTLALILTTLCSFALVSQPALAAADGGPKAFNIPAETGDKALKLFSEQSGLEVVFGTATAGQVRTNAVKGELPPREALARLLDGTGLVVTANEKTGALTISRDPNVQRAAQAKPDDRRPLEKSDLGTRVEGNDPALTLSPFEVLGERDTGYAATDTLAGTRLRTPLRDVAASISVVTKDMLDDLGATNVANLLVYTTGTEVVGIGGNFSGSAANTYNQDFETQRESVSPNTRVRGLAGADQTRNFFTSPFIPLDVYNTQSVTINRGANAILFGFGSPAGIIENTLISPSFKNRGSAQVRAGSYGTYRSSLDVDRVLVEKKLAGRIALVDETKKFEQDAAYREQKRLFGALTYRPFKLTTIKLNGETGKIDQRLPRVDPPLDSMTTWWWFGKPAREDNFFNAGSAARTIQRANNTDGQFGGWTTNPGLIYPSASAQTPVDGFPAQATVAGTTYYYGGPRSSAEIERFVYNNPIGGFLLARQVLDRSIFDYRKEMIDGPNSGTEFKFNTANIAVEQLFLGGDAGVELVYDYQDSMQSILRKFAGYRGNNLFIDPNKLTNDGRPNPNFGRPVVLASGRFVRDNAEYATARATGFIKHDFRRLNNFLGRLLGTQTLTGLWTDHKNDVFDLQGWSAVAANGWRGGTNGAGLGDRAITAVVYLGPSLANAATPANAHLSGVRNSLVYPASFSVWNTFAPTGATAPAGTNWSQYNTPIYSYPDYAHLADTVTLSNNKARSYAGVWQGNWWDNSLVSTAGWRHDEVDTAFGSQTTIDPATGARPVSRPKLTPGLSAQNSTFSYGVAYHLPAKWLGRLPGRPLLSLYYNDSANFQITGARRNMTGGYFAPQEGDTREIGVGLSALDNKFSVRVSWYETRQDNITDDRITPILFRLATLEQLIIGNIPKSRLDAAGYVGVDNPSLSPRFQQYLKYVQFNQTGTRSDGTVTSTFINPPGTVEVTDATSKGLELDAIFNPTKNWRILFNAARQEAVRGETSATFGALVDERLAQWKNPVVWGSSLGAFTGQSYAEVNILNPLTTARLQVGAPVPELRKWRANMVTNYKFDRESFLRNWSIGGAARWQDRAVIGFPVINPPSGMVVDISHPFMSSDMITYDSWLSYERRIFNNRIGWKLQLNVRNLLDDNLMIPVRANPVAVNDLVHHENVAYRIGERRTWEVTSTFSF